MDDDRAPAAARPTPTTGSLARAILAASTEAGATAASSAAKLALVLRLRPGHVVVTGPDARVVETLLRATESQLGAMRMLRVSSRALGPGGILHALRDAARDGRVAVVVTDADQMSAAELEQLHTGIDKPALERGDLRLVLLGGSALRQTIGARRLEPLAARVCLWVDVPSADVTSEVAVSGARASRQERVPRRARWFGVIALGGLAIGAVSWSLLSRDTLPPAPGVKVASVPEPVPDLVSLPVAPPTIAVDTTEPPEIVGPPPPVEPAPQAAPRSIAATLQVGAFADPGNAARLAARLRPRFGRVEVDAIERGARMLHRVRIAGFVGEAEVGEARRALAAEGLEAVRVRPSGARPRDSR